MGAPSASPGAQSVAIGTVLDGRYRIDGVLGTGGMGRVYRGQHTGIGRAVAIKVLHADLGKNKEAAARFQREALASGRLDHPNIVGVSDFGVLEDGCFYLVMEALEGESLGARLERDKRIPWQEALEIVRGVLAGLRHAHDRGVVHRDIKPDNIFLARKDGEQIVKVLDFGIAKLYAGDADDPATTRAGLTVGTPAYLSPEQAVGGAITPASDLYSTSVVLYEMIAGRAPFEDKDPLAMLTAHVSREAPRFAEIAPDLSLPAGLEDVIRHGLDKVAVQRIGSAPEYQQRLDDVLRAAGLGHVIPIALRTSGQVIVPPAITTPVPGSLTTPMPFATAAAAPATEQMTAVLPRRAAGAGVRPPILRTWLLGAAIAAAVAVAIVIVVALGTGGRGKPDPAKPTGPAPVVVPQAPAASVPTIDRETRLRTAVRDLETGKTCAERKAAIPTLQQLGDERAIVPLKAARYRMRGGVLGIGDSNTNSCLKAEAETAIKALGGSFR